MDRTHARRSSGTTSPPAVLATGLPAASLALLAHIGSASAQDAYHDSYQTWTSLTVQGHATRELQLYADVTARFYDDSHPYQPTARPALGFRLEDGMYVWAGYAWTPGWNARRQFIDEHRAWQQWSYDIPGLPAGLRVLVRSRFEQRVRPESGRVALRARQFARLLVPFAPGSPVHLSLWDEIFFALSDAANTDGSFWQRTGVEQNRIFVGLGWSVEPGLRIEAGYLNHWIIRPQADEIHHVLSINVLTTVR